MQEENKQIDPLDEFSLLIREKMSGHRLAVPAEDWEALDAKLQKRKRLKNAWLGMAGVVAAIGLLFLLIPVPGAGPLQEPGIAEQVKEERHWQQEEEVRQEPHAIPMKELRSVVTKKVKKVSVETENTSKENQMEEIYDAEVINVLPTVPQTEEEFTEKDPEKEVSGKQENKQDFYRSLKPEPASRKKKNFHSGWQAGVVIGSGGRLNFSSGGGLMLGSDTDPGLTDPGPDGNEGPDPDPGKPDPEEPETRGAPITKPGGSAIETGDNYITDTRYSVPVTVGFTFRKEWNQYIGIESGLLYTYLSTSYTRRGSRQADAKAHMHYLGIPLNVVWTAWQNPNWNLYFSAGGMAEKGFRMYYKEVEYGKNSGNITEIKGSIHGLQWSVNFSPGLTYRITKEWGIYVEPRISYYFDNNQPESIRTDKPLVVGIGGGVRYHF